MTKQPLVSIEIERVEGNFEDCFTATASTFKQAEKIIQLMAQSAPTAGYDKTDFTITWESTTYSGRIDLQQHMADIEDNLVSHIMQSMEYRINQVNIPEDARITQEEYDEFVRNYLHIKEVTQ